MWKSFLHFYRIYIWLLIIGDGRVNGFEQNHLAAVKYIYYVLEWSLINWLDAIYRYKCILIIIVMKFMPLFITLSQHFLYRSWYFWFIFGIFCSRKRERFGWVLSQDKGVRLRFVVEVDRTNPENLLFDIQIFLWFLKFSLDYQGVVTAICFCSNRFQTKFHQISNWNSSNLDSA